MTMHCFFASDLHGDRRKYELLAAAIAAERPAAVFLGGDLLPAGAATRPAARDFLSGYLAPALRGLRAELGPRYPRVLAILGNDDERAAEADVRALADEGLVDYMHKARTALAAFEIFGYACVPPTPFLLKDWERYDVSRFVDPGCVSPEEGVRTLAVPPREARRATIRDDLERLGADRPLAQAVFLFHAPPHGTLLDRADLDRVRVEGVAADVHVGSIAIRRFIERRQPLLTLHGHVHETVALSGAWRQRLGRTWMFTAAHDGPELALIRFDLGRLDEAARELL